jgi:hypothetical protein
MNAAFYATGNNLTIAGDLTRRVIMATLDANCERPEMRTFNVDARTEALTHRPELVAAALTVLRAWHVAKSCRVPSSRGQTFLVRTSASLRSVVAPGCDGKPLAGAKM